MSHNPVRPLFLVIFIFFLFCVNAFALCYETCGGKLQSGSIEKYIPSILRSYENDVPNGAVYTVQRQQGFYFKVCDEADQVKNFMEKWVYAEVSEGDWQSILSTRDKDKLYIIKNVGVYKVRKEGAIWKVWKYAEKSPGKTSPYQKIKPERQYRQFILTDNAVYGVTTQKTKDGKYIPVELTGKEKVKVVLNEFTMKTDVTIDMLKPGGSREKIVDILRTEKKFSVNLLNKWLTDTNPLNREKAKYLLGIVR